MNAAQKALATNAKALRRHPINNLEWAIWSDTVEVVVLMEPRPKFRLLGERFPEEIVKEPSPRAKKIMNRSSMR
jgi:hypothetical protein